VEASHLAALGVDSRLVHVLDHQSVSVPTQRARALVAHHLVRGKRVESDLPRGFYDPAPPAGRRARNVELFLGVQLGHPPALVLTNRLLVVPLAGRDKRRRRLVRRAACHRAGPQGDRATGWQERGPLRVVRLQGPVEERRVVVRACTLAPLLGHAVPEPRRRP